MRRMLFYLHVKVDVDAVENSSGETLLDGGDHGSSRRETTVVFLGRLRVRQSLETQLEEIAI